MTSRDVGARLSAAVDEVLGWPKKRPSPNACWRKVPYLWLQGQLTRFRCATEHARDIWSKMLFRKRRGNPTPTDIRDCQEDPANATRKSDASAETMRGSGGTGLADVPLEKESVGRIGLHKEIRGLARFIATCATPMTIAIQGDWGSGKTSIMRALERELKKESTPGERVKTVQINTWQFSQFGEQGDLTLAVIEKIVRDLDPEFDDGATLTAKLIKRLQRASLATLRSALGTVAASVPVVGDAVKAGFEEGTRSEPQTDASGCSTVEATSQLKAAFEKQVKASLEEEGAERFVVFIDDLDRLRPSLSVEVMEALKIFLDVPSCVFVLAIDFDVVRTGVAAKYGNEISDRKARSFFDKMIQVPFSLRPATYDVGEFFSEGLKRVGVEVDRSTESNLLGLAHATTRSNPRALKRLLNSLALSQLIGEAGCEKRDGTASLVAEAAGGPGSADADDEEMRSGTPLEQRFAALCMQVGYPAAFEAMTEEREPRADLLTSWRRSLGGENASEGPKPEELFVQLELTPQDRMWFCGVIDLLAEAFGGGVSDEGTISLEESALSEVLEMVSVLTSRDRSVAAGGPSMKGSALSESDWVTSKSGRLRRLARALEQALNGSEVELTQSFNWWTAHKKATSSEPRLAIGEIFFRKDSVRATVGPERYLPGDSSTEKFDAVEVAARRLLGTHSGVEISENTSPTVRFVADVKGVATEDQASALGELLKKVAGMSAKHRK